MTGGKQLKKDGYFVQPTIFSNVNENMTIAREEVFIYLFFFVLFNNIL